MKQLLMNDYTLMLESDKKAKNIITIVVLFAIFLNCMRTLYIDN